MLLARRPGEGPERGLNLEKAVEPQKNQPYAVPGAINQRVRLMKAGNLLLFG